MKRISFGVVGRCLAWLVAVGISTASAQSSDARAALSRRAELLRSWRGDADLTAACFLDRRFGWVVGDRGAILATTDGGEHWTPQESGVECRLRDVCFIDELRGWAVGGRYDTYVHRSRGVVLQTVNGGRTWETLPAALLPALRQIRMTSPTEGYAAGDASELFPAGLLFTRDGGRTWIAAAGRVTDGLSRADLAAPNSGLAVDARGCVAQVAERAVDGTQLVGFGLRSARDIVLRTDGAGWLVGDGGLVLFTPDAGASWHHPGHDLSVEAGGQCDWRSIACRGSQAWIVGSPGSVVLRTIDDGRTWQKLSAGQSLPLADVVFVDETHGWAVGAMGTIMHTADGGVTWRAQSPMVRPALLACYTDAEAVPAELIADAAAEQGYRAAAVIVGQRGFEPGEKLSPGSLDRAADALAALGVSSVAGAWAFPLRQRGIEPTTEAVLAAWGQGNATAAHAYAEAYLVRQIRVWRPEVVLTHDAAPRGDAPTRQLWHQLVMQAVEAAADPSRYPEQIEQLGLQPWRVQKAFGGEAGQLQGTLVLKTGEATARLGLPLDEFCEPSRALLGDRRLAPPAVAACRMYVNRTAATGAASDLFAGLTIPPGGEARRLTTSIDGPALVRERRAAERRRQFQAVVMQKTGTAGTGLPDQIQELCRGLDDDEAGRLIFRLGETFRAAGRWEAARTAYEYLLATRPQHADADAAVHRLIYYFASAEADQRLRRAVADMATNFPQAAAPKAARTGGEVLPAVAATADEPVVNPANFIVAEQPEGPKVGRLDVRIAPGPPTITNEATVPTPAARLLGRDDFETPPPASRAEIQGLTISSESFQSTTATSSAMSENPAAANDAGHSAGMLFAADNDDAARRQKALVVGAYYEQRDPAAAADPAIAFPLASARRRAGRTAEAESFFSHFARTRLNDAWWECAAAENALNALQTGAATNPKPVYAARRAPTRPRLDGKLDDDAWRDAAPLELRDPSSDPRANPAAAYIAFDDEYLYLAVRCRRAPPLAAAQPSGPRQRDEALSAFDRVDFCFDADRDYAVYYRLTVDCRGHTADSCWDDPSWDPRWFVAAGGDGETWIVEAAVPWADLNGRVPDADATWGLGVQRLAPTSGLQSWSSPAAAEIRSEGFGHLTFQ